MQRQEVSAGTRGYGVPTRTTVRVPLALALLAGLARLPFLNRPLSPDEGGFLLLAHQWSPGSSLYGAYWVDRPPLLIGIFAVADRLAGGGAGLRIVGVVAVGIAVVLAGVLGHLAAPERRWAPVLAAATAAVFLSTPLFGTREVNGELLAVPFILGGLIAVFRAVDGGRRAVAWWAASGALAACSVAVKQNMADVVVAGLVALVWQVRFRGLRRTAYDALAAAAGAIAALVVILVWAATRGTDPRALFDAVVSFRFHAAAVISADDPGVSHRRFMSMLGALVRSGAPVIFLLPILRAPRARLTGCLPFVAACVCAWEAVGVAAGGSYWWHYLIGLVPGLVLVATALSRHRPGLQASLVAVLAYATVLGVHMPLAQEESSRGLKENHQAALYLADHARPGDTGLVAFGTASILRESGLQSPYEYLWSLPVRVRDSRLTELTAVLSGPRRPDWVVVPRDDLATWAVDTTTAQRVLDQRYRLVARVGKWRFFHVVEAAASGT
ncbi:hypothetical protein JCM18899A_16670 [Nocardioides sp. AN3]